MFKQNHITLLISIIAMLYNAFEFIFYPNLVHIWIIRIIGGFFIISAIGYILDIQKIYLQRNINKLNKQIFKNKRL